MDGFRLRTAIVMCTYNGEAFLRAQIESILRQERLPDAMLISDDGSVDGTLAILEESVDRLRDAGVSVSLSRTERNLGYVRNFESALSRVDADLVFLCDQDDVWHPGKIARMAHEFERSPGLGMLHTDAQLIDSHGAPLASSLFEALRLGRRELDLVHRGQGLELLVRRSVATGATMAIRKAALDDALPFPDGWVHDEWLAMCVALLGRFDALEERLVGYRQHAGNQIGVPVPGRAGPRRPSRRAHLRAQVSRLQALQAWLQQRDLGGSVAALVASALSHARSRAELPAPAMARARHVVGEALNGGYGRFSMGWRSMLSDLAGLD